MGLTNDHVTNVIRDNCYNFFHETNIDRISRKIFSDEIDILIFLDIGMEPKMQILGSLKLAKFQCCTWGVPVTTGLDSIDYFLTSELMETDFAQKHYTEKLIKLTGLSVDYDAPRKILIENLDTKKDIDKDKTIFLSLQSNYKLLPQHDNIYFEIIKKNPKCIFWFIGEKNDLISDKFKERIFLLCKKNNISLDNFFYFYPQMPYHNYLDLISRSDIILDSLDWSGFNTSLDAISLNKPIVTLPSNFMRGRHTYAILKTLKIDELISNSKKNYVDLAYKLSTDFIFLNNVIEKIKKNKKLLFNNLQSTKSLENFLQSLFKTKR